MSKSKKILIAGGGIGGMSAGLSLLQRGFDVELYERAEELQEVGAGVQISPNGGRALDALGVFAHLQELSCAPTRKEFRLWDTGKAWPMFDLGEQAVSKYGYPYLTVYRPDLLDALAAGVRKIRPEAIHLGSRITSLREESDAVVLEMEGGREARGDVLIGADGVRSVVREKLWGGGKPKFSGMVAWRGVIPMERLPAHQRVMVGSTWIGPGGHVVCYPLRRGELMNFVGTIERQDWQIESWRALGAPEECANDFRGWHDDVQAMILAAPALFKWALMGRDPMPRWSKDRITLLGDACHPTLPFLAQGAVMAIEDAVVLGRCLADASDNIAETLRRYERARIERTSRMVLGARDNTARFHNAELADEIGAQKYLEREWSREPIRDRYDWLYSYDATAVAV